MRNGFDLERAHGKINVLSKENQDKSKGNSNTIKVFFMYG